MEEKMKLFRVINLLLLLILPVSALFASPKESVAIIECKPDSTFNAPLSRIAESFREHGYNDVADYMDSLKKGWQGSGFVVSDAQGKRYLISNKHVLGNSGDVTIKFPHSDKTITRSRSDVYEHKTLDIALLDLSGIKVKLKSIPIYRGTVKDGTDIFSAGYPDLLGNPTWQLSKGIVSNNKTAVPSIVNPSICKFIQHSAAIDPGSSGGPVLLKKRGTWQVIGVSTFTVVGRQDTHFAIPVSKVQHLINQYKRSKATAKRQSVIKKELNAVAADITKQFNTYKWDGKKEHRYVSTELAAQYGWDAILQLFNSDDRLVAENMAKRFQSISFFEAMRECVSWSMWANYRKEHKGDKNKFKVLNLKEVPVEKSDGAVAIAEVAMGDETHDMQFIYERGHWYVHSVPEHLSTKDQVLEAQDRNIGDSISFHIGPGMVPGVANNEYNGNDTIGGIGLYAAWTQNVFRYFDYGHAFYLGSLKYTRNNSDIPGDEINGQGIAFDYQFFMRLIFPVRIPKGYIAPFALTGIELGLMGSDEFFMFYAPVDAGGGLEYWHSSGHGVGFSAYRRFKVFNLYDEVRLEDLRMNFYYTFRIY
jgi:S1-C subfamily serine protease